MAIVLGILTWKFMLAWTKSETAGYLALILVYFGGGLGWIVNLYRDEPLGGESMFWSTQSISTLINPPFAFSLILLLSGLILFRNYIENTNEQQNNKSLKHKNFKTQKQTIKLKSITTLLLFISCSVILGITVHAKSYAGILALSSLAILAIPENLAKVSNLRKVFQPTPQRNNAITLILLSSSLISLITLIPITKLTGQSFFQFNPLWFPRTMLLFEDRFHWPQLFQAIQAYWATGNWPKGLLADGLAITIFYLGNLGIRIIGLWAILSAIPPLFKEGQGVVGITKKNVISKSAFDNQIGRAHV